MRIRSIRVLSLILLAAAFVAQAFATEVPKEKQTVLGLYVTAQEAYEKWKADPAKVKVLDVRTLEEYIYTGHAAMAWNVPLAVQTHEWDPARKHFAMKPSPDFVARVKAIASPRGHAVGDLPLGWPERQGRQRSGGSGVQERL